MIEVQNLVMKSLQRLEEESINREQQLTMQYNELHQRLEALSRQQQNSEQNLQALNDHLHHFSSMLTELFNGLEEKLMNQDE